MATQKQPKIDPRTGYPEDVLRESSVPAWKLALMDAPGKQGALPNAANTIRGLANSVIPGLSINSRFEPDIYNPFTGSGRDPEFSPNATEAEGLSNYAQVAASGGIKGLSKLGTKAAGRAGAEGVELMFKNKTWDMIPDAMKEDPAFARAAQEQFGKLKGKGISEVPTLIRETGKQAGGAISRVAGKIGGKAKAMMTGLGGAFADNPLKAKAATAPIVAGANLMNDAKSQIDNEAVAQPTAAPAEDFSYQDVPTTVDEGGPQFTGLEQPKKTAAQQIMDILAGNRGLTPYQKPKENWITRMGRYGNQQEFEQNDQEAAIRDYQRQMLERGYVDPETQAKLDNLRAELSTGRDQQTQALNDTRDFTRQYAPAINNDTVESVSGLPPGSIDSRVMHQLATQKKDDPFTQALMSILAAQMGSGQGTAQPTINIPGANPALK